MPLISEDDFLSLIQSNTGIIFKVINLYLDVADEKADLYQEIVLQAWRSYSTFKGKSKFSTWLYQLSLNTALTYNRKKYPYKNKVDLSETVFDKATTQNLEDSDLLMQALRTLNEVDRSIIALHLDGYNHQEVAEIVGITKNHVAVKVHRIKNELQQTLKEFGYGY
jgi:RNA polymerase sigma-70 factor (ECF subfamily)